MLVCVSAAFGGGIVSGGEFYRDHPARQDTEVSNSKRWLRVNDAELSLHETFGKTPEAKANGLMLVPIDEDLFLLERAELCLDMWGGHPGTTNKRFTLNGKQVYDIPEVGRRFGGQVCFCCPVSYQTTSITGTREQIFEDVRVLVESLGHFDGGLLGYVEEYQSIGLSEANYQACMEAFRTFGQYRRS